MLSNQLIVVIDHVAVGPELERIYVRGIFPASGPLPAELAAQPPAGTTRSQAVMPPGKVVIESALAIVLKQNGGDHGRR